ncbi:MAG TPA: aminodeoxychorismate synthase component I [Deltaproteobacteria bacterium]|nr:aminodeoxychorismate synthase component I [Deltaproteobacteria bacterium]
MHQERIAIESPAAALRAISRLEMPFACRCQAEGAGGPLVLLGAEPYMVLSCDGRGTRLSGARDGLFADPFSALSAIIADHAPLPEAEGPFPFNGGAFGYFSYDLKDLVEPSRRPASQPAASQAVELAAAGLPRALLGFYDPVIVWEEETRRAWAVSYQTQGWQGRLERLREALSLGGPEPGALRPSRFCLSDFTREGYMEAVERAIDYIAAGDIYQVNLSQRLVLEWSAPALRAFEALGGTDGAPFSAYLDAGPFQVVSNSPELLLRVRGRRAETRPIKGTRRRGADRRADRAMVDELRNSPKERAEHVMIVDLERNDLGRVCEPGTVRVRSFGRIETFPGLHHMVSVVEGRLREGVDSAQCLRNVFPGGSITGAPKIRAMEIIDELEPTPRELYTGAVGWCDLSGDMELAMAIRTAVVKDGLMYLGVGGAVVADSDPACEYDETILKAAGFLAVAGVNDGLRIRKR